MARFYCGLDLGQTADPTALAILERPPPPEGGRAVYAVRHLRRWPLRTSYPALVEDARALLALEPLKGCSVLCVDATGVGRPIVDLFRQARAAGRLGARLVPITFTGGEHARQEGGWWWVPKRDLVGAAVALLQTRRLLISPGLAEAPALARELENFRSKITPGGGEALEAWRERDHDDLLFAVAMACWLGEREPDWQIRPPSRDNRSVIERMPPGVFHGDRPRGMLL